MNVKEYMAIAKKTDNLEPVTPTEPNYKVAPILGLAGEIGELLTELKKRVREPERINRVSKERLEEELGDIIWYAVTIARRAGIDFRRGVLLGNLRRLRDNPDIYRPLLKIEDKPEIPLRRAIKKHGVGSVDTFGSYQGHAVKSAKFTIKRKALIANLAKIWMVSDRLLKDINLVKAVFEEWEKSVVVETLGDVMWYLAGFAAFFDLDLDKIAKDNKNKTLSMFMPEDDQKPTPLYDKDDLLLEQFPREFDVIFAPAPWNKEVAIMSINGIRIGNPLKDNAYKPKKDKKKTKKGKSKDDPRMEIDGYRFHDSIHFAFVAILGWSPVMRGLMKRKRKKNEDVDDADDGARAQIVEEMIVKLAHSYAVGVHKKKLLDNEKRVSFDLLKQIKILASGLEVTGGREGSNPVEYWEWGKAILEGFRVYNDLRTHRKGRLHIDLDQRSIDFVELKDGEEDHFPSWSY